VADQHDRLVISYGTATETVLPGDRLLETALGAAIGALSTR
jgi:hypothetical protein